MDVNEVGSSFRFSIFVVRRVFDWTVLTLAQGGMAEFKFLNANMLSVFIKRAGMKRHCRIRLGGCSQ